MNKLVTSEQNILERWRRWAAKRPIKYINIIVFFFWSSQKINRRNEQNKIASILHLTIVWNKKEISVFHFNMKTEHSFKSIWIFFFGQTFTVPFTSAVSCNDKTKKAVEWLSSFSYCLSANPAPHPQVQLRSSGMHVLIERTTIHHCQKMCCTQQVCFPLLLFLQLELHILKICGTCMLKTAIYHKITVLLETESTRLWLIGIHRGGNSKGLSRFYSYLIFSKLKISGKPVD